MHKRGDVTTRAFLLGTEPLRSHRWAEQNRDGERLVPGFQSLFKKECPIKFATGIGLARISFRLIEFQWFSQSSEPSDWRLWVWTEGEQAEKGQK